MKKIFDQNNLKYFIFTILFIFLMFNYLTNCFHVCNIDWFNSWQADSESIIKGRIYTMEHFGLFYNMGLLENSDGYDQGFFDPSTIYAYLSQLGLGGTLWGAVHFITHSINFCYQLNVFIFCIIIFAILKWIFDEVGTLPAIAAYIVCFGCKWIVVSAKNLYWMPFVFILPLVISLFILKREEKTGKLSMPLWLSLIFLAVFIKAGCGFEMISLVLLNAVLPIFYYGYKNKWKLKKIFLRFFMVGTAGILGFLSVVFLHLIQMTLYYGSLSDAIHLFQNNIAKRTAAIPAASELPNIYAKSLQASKISVLITYLTKKSLIFGLKMKDILIIYFISLILSFKTAEDTRKLFALEILTTLSLLGPISWYVLASPHSYIHTHINYILWCYPALIFIFSTCVYIFIKGFRFLQK